VKPDLTGVKHEIKSCGRCKTHFECKVGNIMHYQCIEVQTSEETKEFLTQTYYDCMCKACLTELDAMVKLSQKTSFPMSKRLMIEGLHYNFESSYWVFTEFYHLSRGSCCGNNCKNCAYGFEERN
tara:strand:+ start:4361 stop:4735 length:375 start_codon:yes stop_codon:yes gene_type:complete